MRLFENDCLSESDKNCFNEAKQRNKFLLKKRKKQAYKFGKNSRKKQNAKSIINK